MEEELYTVFTVEDVFKDLTYTARMDCYVLRGGRLVQTATGRITHGYARGPGPPRLEARPLRRADAGGVPRRAGPGRERRRAVDLLINLSAAKRAIELFHSGKVEAMRQMLDDDVVWSIPHSHPLAADIVGVDERHRVLSRVQRETDGTFGAEVLDIAGNDRRVFCLMHVRAKRPARRSTRRSSTSGSSSRRPARSSSASSSWRTSRAPTSSGRTVGSPPPTGKAGSMITHVTRSPPSPRPRSPAAAPWPSIR